MSEENTKKSHPKYRNQSIFVYLVVLIVAWFVGQAIFQEASGVFLGDVWIYAILSVLGGYIVGTIVYETGKLIFGKIAGYRLVSFNIFGLCIRKNEKGKTIFARTNIENFGGGTLMAPKKESAHPYLYLSGGFLFTVIASAIGILIAVTLSKHTGLEQIQYVEYLIVSVSLLILILNLAPVMNDDIFDGFLIRLLMTHALKKEDFHYVLLQKEALLTGIHPLTYREVYDYENPVSASIPLYNFYYLIDRNEEEKAEKVLEEVVEHGEMLQEEELGIIYSNLIYLLFLRGEIEAAETKYWELDKPIRKIASSYHHFDTMKTAILIAAFVDMSYDLYEYITTRIEKEKSHFSPLRRNSEDLMIEKALNFIEIKKPEWFIKETEEEGE